MFLIEFTNDTDALVRLLGLFAVHDCRLKSLGLEAGDEAARLRVHALGLDPAKADHLRLRLTSLPAVRGVSLGWQAPVVPPDP